MKKTRRKVSNLLKRLKNRKIPNLKLKKESLNQVSFWPFPKVKARSNWRMLRNQEILTKLLILFKEKIGLKN